VGVGCCVVGCVIVVLRGGSWAVCGGERGRGNGKGASGLLAEAGVDG